MPLTGVDRVRTLIGDMNKISIRELLGKGSAAGNQWQTDGFPIRTGSYAVFVSGIARASASASIALGVIDYSGVTTAVTGGAEVRCTYQFNALSDQEIDFCLDLASGGGPLLAAAYAARSIAGNQAKLFSYSLGNKTVNKDRLADKMLELAESLEAAYEKNISLAGISLTIGAFGDSGTAFDHYDTGIAANYSSGIYVL